MSHRKVQKFGSVWADGSAFEVASLFPRCCSRLASPTRVLRGASPERGHRSLRVGALASATEVSARSVSPLPSCLSRRRTREEVCSSVGAPALWRREGGFQPAARARWNDLLEPVGKDSSPSEDASKTSTRWPAAKCRAQWKGGKETPNIEVPEVCAVTENKEVCGSRTHSPFPRQPSGKRLGFLACSGDAPSLVSSASLTNVEQCREEQESVASLLDVDEPPEQPAQLAQPARQLRPPSSQTLVQAPLLQQQSVYQQPSYLPGQQLTPPQPVQAQPAQPAQKQPALLVEAPAKETEGPDLATNVPWLAKPVLHARRLALGLRPGGRAVKFAQCCEFVSLGSYCAVARALQALEIKKFSYPFDWARSSMDGVIHCFDNQFADFLTHSSFKDHGTSGKCFGNSAWGGSFWHHDPSNAKTQKDFERRIDRLYGRGEVDALAPRVFVRALNSTQEMGSAVRLLETLRRALPGSQVYLLLLVDNQAREGPVRLQGSEHDGLLVWRGGEGLFAHNGKHWTMQKQSEAYAEAIAYAIRYWSEPGKEGATEEVSSLESLISSLSAFEGGDAACALYWPRRLPTKILLPTSPLVSPRSASPRCGTPHGPTWATVRHTASAQQLSSHALHKPMFGAATGNQFHAPDAQLRTRLSFAQ